jgi:hypothetical protein
MEAMFQLKEVAPKIQDLPTAMPLEWKGCAHHTYIHTYSGIVLFTVTLLWQKPS